MRFKKLKTYKQYGNNRLPNNHQNRLMFIEVLANRSFSETHCKLYCSMQWRDCRHIAREVSLVGSPASVCNATLFRVSLNSLGTQISCKHEEGAIL